jgi:hypothetical protein
MLVILRGHSSRETLFPLNLILASLTLLGSELYLLKEIECRLPQFLGGNWGGGGGGMTHERGGIERGGEGEPFLQVKRLASPPLIKIGDR